MVEKKYLHLAKTLRRNATDTEEILWRELRGRRLGGYKFRRQVPIGSFIVDFVCEAKKFIIEVDGGDHEDKTEADAARTRRLEIMGYHVYRVWDDDVDRFLEDVLGAICDELDGI